MPLTGFVCDLDNRERVPCAECIACAAAPAPPRGRRCHFTASMLAAMAGADAVRGDAGISATGLVGCLRQTYLNMTEAYYAPPKRLWPSLRARISLIIS